MGFAVVVVKAVLLLQLSLLLLSTFTVSAPISPQASPPHYHAVSPVVPPTHPPTHHHHHHHHHPHPHPPTKPPTPTPPPVHPPPKAPVKPPTKPPTHSPTNPPTKPPTQPPTKPPTKPPTHPPSYPPANPTASNVSVQGVVYCKSCKYAGVDTLLGAKPIPRATVRLTCKDAKNDLTLQFRTDKNGYFFVQAPITIYNFDLHNCSVSLVSSPLKACSKPSNLNGGLKGAPLKPEKPSSKKLPYVLYSVGPFAFEPTCHKS